MEAERGLGPEFSETLMDLTTQLRGLGTNLNQLAHAANEGRPVVLDQALSERIGAAIHATRGVVNDVRNRMSE
jgi:hypothetical protein